MTAGGFAAPALIQGLVGVPYSVEGKAARRAERRGRTLGKTDGAMLDLIDGSMGHARAIMDY